MRMNVNTARGCERSDVVAALCALLSEGDEADRCYSCRALGALGATEAIPALIERLRDEDVDVCVDAASALGRLGSPAVIDSLNDSLRNDPDGEVKIAVVESLARVADAQTIPVLLEIAERRPEEMVFDESGDWDPWWDMQREAVLALGRAQVKDAAPVLARLLEDEDGQDIDAEIMSALAQLGEPGERILLERLRRGREQVRRRAVAALARGHSPRSLEALSRALKDDSSQVRVAALEALERRGGRRYLPNILKLYRDPDAAVRQAAIRVGTRLAEAGGAETPDVDALLPLLGDKDPKVRASVLLCLDRAGLDEGLSERLRQALRDPEPEVAAIACALLGRHGTESQFEDVVRIAEDKVAEAQLRRAALRAIGARGIWNEAVASLMAETLSESKSPARLAALDALLDLHRAGAGAGSSADQSSASEIDRMPEPLALIVAALSGDGIAFAKTQTSPEVASENADAATARNYEIPVEVAASSPETRPAKSSLEAIAIDNAEVALALAQDDSDDSGKEIEIDEETAEYLALTEANEAAARWMFTREALETDLDVRRLAARILGSAAEEPVIHALTEALACEDPALRREAAASLAAIADRLPQSPALAEGLEALLEGAGADDRDLRIACLHALARVRDSRAHDCLLAALDDKEPAVRIEAVRALGVFERSIPPASTIDAGEFFDSDLSKLLERLGDPEPGVRIAAARALAGMLRGRDVSAEKLSQVIEALTRAGFAGSGDQAREMGRALRDISPDRATGHLLEALRGLATSAERRVAIDMLEEIHRVRDPGAVKEPQGDYSSKPYAGELAT